MARGDGFQAYFWSFMMLPCLYKSACLLRKLSRYCQLHIKYWQKLVQIHEKSAIYCCHIVSPQSSSHIQLPFYFWKVYKVNKKFMFIKLSNSLKEKHSNIWEMYIISCIRCIFMTLSDILSFSGFYESDCKISALQRNFQLYTITLVLWHLSLHISCKTDERPIFEFVLIVYEVLEYPGFGGVARVRLFKMSHCLEYP